MVDDSRNSLITSISYLLQAFTKNKMENKAMTGQDCSYRGQKRRVELPIYFNECVTWEVLQDKVCLCEWKQISSFILIACLSVNHRVQQQTIKIVISKFLGFKEKNSVSLLFSTWFIQSASEQTIFEMFTLPTDRFKMFPPFFIYIRFDYSRMIFVWFLIW